ncbi:MAG: hypothetical protein D6675_11975 [Gemmatimonadetes bacterium]|nr:MAG: hypothetical protein D6675_11975 [Gemmatimonadota bacterium]
MSRSETEIMSPSHRRRCPECNRPLERIHRKWWMRLVPCSRLYSCGVCSKKYLFIGKKRWLKL